MFIVVPKDALDGHTFSPFAAAEAEAKRLANEHGTPALILSITDTKEVQPDETKPQPTLSSDAVQSAAVETDAPQATTASDG